MSLSSNFYGSTNYNIHDELFAFLKGTEAKLRFTQSSPTVMSSILTAHQDECRSKADLLYRLQVVFGTSVQVEIPHLRGLAAQVRFCRNSSAALWNVGLTDLRSFTFPPTSLFMAEDILLLPETAPLGKTPPRHFKNLTGNDLTLRCKFPELSDGFLVDCHLRKLDLSDMPQTKIGKNFCKGGFLEVVLLPRKVTNSTIPLNFLQFCQGLVAVNLVPLAQVTAIEDYFMQGTGKASLQAVDFSPLTEVTNIGKSFLGQTPLATVDLSCMKKVHSIGSGFLAGSKVKLVVLPTVLGTSIPSKLCWQCNELTSIDLSHGCQNVVAIEHYFLCECFVLEHVNLVNFVLLAEIGENFLSGCPALKEIDLRFSERIRKIGKNFLQNSNPGVCVRVPPEVEPYVEHARRLIEKKD